MSPSMSHWRVPMVPRETTSVPRSLGGVGDGDGALVDVETKVEGFATMFHG